MKIIKDRVAVVTGGGSGIGRAVALALASRGAHIALVDVNAEALAESKRLVEEHAVTTSTHIVDVSSREQLSALPEQVIAEHGAVHILVNNAGVSVSHTFVDQSVEDLEWITGINYWGVMYGCKFFLPYLLEQDEAHIVNMSSSAGLSGMKGQSSYGATKFAVRGLSESLYVELARTNVGVTCVHPGAVATNILNTARMAEDDREKMLKYFHMAVSPDKAAQLILRAIEKKRFKLVFCPESRALNIMKRITPVGTLKLLRLFNRAGPSKNAPG
jgi:short-subunit dehydrogenase